MPWAQRLLEPLQPLFDYFAVFLPGAMQGIVMLLAGWIIARLSQKILVRVLQALRVEELAEKAKLSTGPRKGAIRASIVELLGQLAYWLLMTATVIMVLQVIGVTAAAEWLEQFGAFIPRLVTSIVIFLVGMLVASFLGTIVRVTSLNAGVAQGYMVGQAVYVAMMLLTVIVALEQLQLVTRTVEVALYICLGTIGLASALALGLGSQEFVKHVLAELWERRKTLQQP